MEFDPYFQSADEGTYVCPQLFLWLVGLKQEATVWDSCHSPAFSVTYPADLNSGSEINWGSMEEGKQKLNPPTLSFSVILATVAGPGISKY